MEKAEQVINFYVLCNKLKNVVRTGWKDWGVKRERVESVAEHIYGTQMLAITMWSEYSYDIDLKKVLSMLAIHEIEETIIGDLTLFQLEESKKQEMGHKAIKKIFETMINGADVENLILEFDERKTPEAVFAYQCDKLECDIQAKLYDEENCVDLSAQNNNDIVYNPNVKLLMERGLTWGEMWMTFSQQRYNYDKNFLEVSNYALHNLITKKDD